MSDEEIDIRELLEPYRDLPELLYAKDCYVPTDAVKNSLRAEGLDEIEKASILARAYVAWAEGVKRDNLIIKRTNEINESSRKNILKEYNKYKQSKCSLISDILDTISKESQDILRGWYEVIPAVAANAAEGIEAEEGITRSFEEATEEGSWLWFFKAAEATHSAHGSTDNPQTLAKRLREEFKRLEDLKQNNLPYPVFQAKFDLQIEIIESINEDALSETVKCINLIDNLNGSLFRVLKEDYYKTEMRDRYPEEYEALKLLVNRKYVEMKIGNPELVKRAESRENNIPRESVFSVTAKPVSADPGPGSKSGGELKSAGGTGNTGKKQQCPICLLKGAAGLHRAENCALRNNKFSIGSNIAYQERIRKKETGGRM
jgi:hypothetical protein